MSNAYELLATFERSQWQWLQLPVVLATAIFVWAAIGLGSFSGRGTLPMFGDFEAQRHWMEITQHLPPAAWYFYDLQWWGLDYPPLTAYHSWLVGKVGSVLDATWFALDRSRGAESPALVAFMRKSVIVSELVFYVPPVVLYARHAAAARRLSITSLSTGLAAVLLQPSVALIDNGHFQYNAVMLGLFVLSLYYLQRSRLLSASVAFVMALMFKQMALYYAPVIFFYMLGQCVFPQLQVAKLFRVGITVLITMVLCLLPFLSPYQLSQVAFRVFPFARGLWEDKVANFWCTLNTFIKLKAAFTGPKLQQLALGATLVAIVPACVASFVNFKKLGHPVDPKVLVWSFSSCAWAFYLFSFQVHEKSVLLPLMPTTLLLLNNDGNVSAMVFWINNIASYSLWPLLQRDGLSYQFFVVMGMWNWLFGGSKVLPSGMLNRLAVVGSYSAILALSGVFELGLLSRYDAYPDLRVLANTSLSFGCFLYFWLWQQYYMFSAVSTA